MARLLSENGRPPWRPCGCGNPLGHRWTASCVDAAVSVGVSEALSTLSLTLMDANNSSLIAVLRRLVLIIAAAFVAEWADDRDRLMSNICG